MSRLYWAWTHPEPKPEGLETEAYNRAWGRAYVLHARSKREAVEVTRALMRERGHVRCQLTTDRDAATVEEVTA